MVYLDTVYMFSIPVYVPPVDKVINNSNRFKKTKKQHCISVSDRYSIEINYLLALFSDYKSQKNQLFPNKIRNAKSACQAVKPPNHIASFQFYQK